jgi:hypothetical protein
MVLFGIQPGASSQPASGPAAERQYVRWLGGVPRLHPSKIAVLLFGLGLVILCAFLAYNGHPAGQY